MISFFVGVKRRRTRENLTLEGHAMTLLAKNANKPNHAELNSLIEDNIAENESSIQFLGLNTREPSTHSSTLPQVSFTLSAMKYYYTGCFQRLEL